VLRHALLLLLALALALAPSPASSEVFRWVDELGVTHYTTDRSTIPRRFRGDAQAIVASPAPRANRAPSAATPPRPLPSESLPSEPLPSEPPPSAALPGASLPSASEMPPPELAPPTPSAAIPAELPATEMTVPTQTPVDPGPIATPAIPPEDPRAAEVAELEERIAADRERLRQIISTKRWDSAELASDPSIREIADRLPRLQAELAALRAETVP
jgi:hypothetical protein